MKLEDLLKITSDGTIKNGTWQTIKMRGHSIKRQHARRMLGNIAECIDYLDAYGMADTQVWRKLVALYDIL
jgi:hypothetical protein